MKTLLLLPLALALPAFAGTQVVSSKQSVAPAPEPCLTSWFVGGSVGYLTELEEPMYTLHVGVTNNCWSIAGWNTSVFLEVGYTETDDDFDPRSRSSNDFLTGEADDDSLDLDDLRDDLQYLADENWVDEYNDPSTGFDLDIIPITLNVKFERALTGNLNVYVGGGLGVARVNLDVDLGGGDDFSDDEWVFAGQLFAGLSYNITPAFQVYGGARWLYIDDADLSDNGGDVTLEVGSDCLLELGARYQF